MFLDDNWLEGFINLKMGQPVKKTFGSVLLSGCFLFELEGSIDTMIKMPPSTEKNRIVLHKVKSISERYIVGLDDVKFIYFDWWEFDLWNRVQLFFGVGC